jgi:hypothetical protein
LEERVKQSFLSLSHEDADIVMRLEEEVLTLFTCSEENEELFLEQLWSHLDQLIREIDRHHENFILEWTFFLVRSD